MIFVDYFCKETIKYLFYVLHTTYAYMGFYGKLIMFYFGKSAKAFSKSSDELSFERFDDHDKKHMRRRNHNDE